MILEAFLVKWLNEKTGYDVYTEAPGGHPEEFYLVERTGSQTENHITTATIAIQSWNSGSMYAAAEMNEVLTETMQALFAEPEISSCKLSADYNFTDTETKYYRYQAVYNITYYREVTTWQTL